MNTENVTFTLTHVRSLVVLLIAYHVATMVPLHSQVPQRGETAHFHVKGVFPNLTVMAPGVGSTSETGIGALIPWADKLWAIGYVAHIQGSGIGLYEISDDMTMRLHPESVTGTFANRMVHWETAQAVIGPHVIDASGTVRTFEELSGHRLTATARHRFHTFPNGFSAHWVRVTVDGECGATVMFVYT